MDFVQTEHVLPPHHILCIQVKVSEAGMNGSRPVKVTVKQLQTTHLHSVQGKASVKPVLNWANVCSPEHTSDTSMNYDSFLN